MVVVVFLKLPNCEGADRVCSVGFIVGVRIDGASQRIAHLQTADPTPDGIVAICERE